VESTGADCIEKPMGPEHLAELRELLDRAGMSDVDAGEFRRYGSERTLYHFNSDHSASY
jgi:hypothetical protein